MGQKKTSQSYLLDRPAWQQPTHVRLPGSQEIPCRARDLRLPSFIAWGDLSYRGRCSAQLGVFGRSWFTTWPRTHLRYVASGSPWEKQKQKRRSTVSPTHVESVFLLACLWLDTAYGSRVFQVIQCLQLMWSSMHHFPIYWHKILRKPWEFHTTEIYVWGFMRWPTPSVGLLDRVGRGLWVRDPKPSP